jgi:hypothetical protein
MNEFLKTYIRARRIANWEDAEEFEFNFLKEKHLYENMVKINSSSIKYIKNPSEQVQLVAVQKNGSSIKYIKNPTDKVKELHREKTK